MQRYEHGSEWRRWDLHVHTPDSVLESKFKNDWESYLIAIEQSKDKVAVIGITDYCSISGYEKIISHRNNGRLKNITSIIPNIEFRITPHTGKVKGINIHLLINPEEKDHVINIKSALSRLTITHKNQIYACIEDQLIAYGKALYPDDNNIDAIFLKHGINNFKPSIDSFKKWYHSEKWLKANSIIVAANGSNDGVSGIKDGGFFGIKTDLYDFTDMIFSATPSDINYFTGQGTKDKDEILKDLGRLIPCIHGSDAHSIEKIFNPDQNKYCWIKADPNFNGLKQVIYEPDRAFIGELCPEAKSEYQTIKRVRYIDGSGKNKFSNNWIALSKDLTTIIGGKSSGKSMLLYHIANTLNPSEVSNKIKLSKSSSYDNLESLDFEVEWSNGETFKLSNDNRQQKAITYIPQLYINQLADKDGKEDLNDLISKTLGQNQSYREFVDRIESEIRTVNTSINEKIDTRFLLIDEFKKHIAEMNEIGDFNSLTAEIKLLEAKSKEIREKSQWTDEQEKQYLSLVHKKQCTLKATSRYLYIYDALEKYIEGIDSNKNYWLLSIKHKLSQDSGLSNNSIILKNLLNSIEHELEKSFIKSREQATERLNLIPSRVEFLDDKLSQIMTLLQPLESKVQDKASLTKLNERLKIEKEKLSKIIIKQKEIRTISERGEECNKELNEQFNKLIDLYKKHCNEISSHQMDDDISIKATVIIDPFKFDAFVNCYNRGGAIRNVINSVVNENGDYCFNISTHSKFVEETARIIKSPNAPALKKNFNLKEAYKNLYSDYFRIDFVVTYKNDSIIQMSPGKRGLVLLSLMLELSNSTHPILIDQPEDNLDNRTIYSELKDFVRKCKNKRQIIMVTHNANLVVSADAECVIVADQQGQESSSKKHQFSYIGGSLEHSIKSDNSYQYNALSEIGIRQHVCHILEGGISAFKEREKKYELI